MTEKENQIVVFERDEIRRVLHDDEWFFSIIDICRVLTGSVDAGAYWRKLKQRLKKEGSEVVTFCHGLKLEAPDGKKYLTDCSNTKGLFRIIQSIPSAKVEPLKQWLAQVGYDRVQEIENPELAQERMKDLYEQKGYPKEWIDKRLRGIAVRQDLTDEWKGRGVQSDQEYAILTNEIMRGTFALQVAEYKNIKGLKRENLRDHMTDIELILTMLAEATTTTLHRDRDSQGFVPLQKDARDGGAVAGRTREDIESKTGKPVVSSSHHKSLKDSASKKRAKK